MEAVEVNWLAVVAAALAANVLGMAWYRTFSARWSTNVQQETGRTNKQLLANARSGATASVAGWALCSVVMAAIVDWSAVSGFADAITLAGVVWAGLVLAVTLPHFAYEGRAWQLQFLDRAYDLTALVAIALILALWD